MLRKVSVEIAGGIAYFQMHVTTGSKEASRTTGGIADCAMTSCRCRDRGALPAICRENTSPARTLRFDRVLADGAIDRSLRCSCMRIAQACPGCWRLRSAIALKERA